MENEVVELAFKRILNLEKKLELYYNMLKTENELSFILNGTYYLQEEIDNILNGNY